MDLKRRLEKVEMRDREVAEVQAEVGQDLLGILPQEETSIAEKLPELSHTPTIIALGASIMCFGCRKHFQEGMLCGLRTAASFNEAVDFPEVTSLLLLSYYIFNLAYADPVTTTLEFLQREMFNVNSERGSKLSKGCKSRTTVNNRIMKLVQQLR
ncbi:hypothetical protein MRX96_007217 [Rhipicephalus microplus]